MNNQIEEFNKKLVDDKSRITIIDYVKKLNDLYFHIDISFIDDFMDLISKKECFIEHELLLKYEIYKFANGSSDMKKVLEQNNAIEGSDYIKRINSDRIIYVLHPILFKKILIRSRNTDKYADYYLLLEEAVIYYNEYQLLQIHEKMNICKDRTLDFQTLIKKRDLLLYSEMKHYYIPMQLSEHKPDM